MATVFLFKLDNFKNEFLANFQQKIETVTILKCEDGTYLVPVCVSGWLVPAFIFDSSGSNNKKLEGLKLLKFCF